MHVQHTLVAVPDVLIHCAFIVRMMCTNTTSKSLRSKENDSSLMVTTPCHIPSLASILTWSDHDCEVKQLDPESIPPGRV